MRINRDIGAAIRIPGNIINYSKYGDQVEVIETNSEIIIDYYEINEEENKMNDNLLTTEQRLGELERLYKQLDEKIEKYIHYAEGIFQALARENREMQEAIDRIRTRMRHYEITASEQEPPQCTTGEKEQQGGAGKISGA